MTGRGLGRGLKLPTGFGLPTPTTTHSELTVKESEQSVSGKTTDVEETKQSYYESSGKKESSSGAGPTTSSGAISGGRGLSSSGRGLTIGRGLTLDVTRTTQSSDTKESKSKDSGVLSVLPPKMIERKPLGRGLGLFPKKMEKLSIKSDSDKEVKKSSSGTTKSESSDTQSQPKELEPVLKHGEDGEPTKILTNYVKLNCDPDFGVFEYDVRFNPQIENQRFRSKLLFQHKDVIGKCSTFDGVSLYLPQKLPENVTYLESPSIDETETVQIKITFRRQKRIQDCIQLYNLLFERIFRILKYQRVGRKQFDPSFPKIVPQHKLEIWPGYVKSVEEQEGGVMLCLDVSHRILSKQTVYEFITDLFHRDAGRFKEEALKSLVGNVVMTRYNNKTYRIDDIAFDMSPKKTFKTTDSEISFIDYYKKQYQIDIKDHDQPLLINRKEVKLPGDREKKEMTFCLVPELAYLTGLSDALRKDFTVMKDLATHTRLTPQQRVNSFKKFIQNVNTNPDAANVLASWGLKLADDPLQLTARQLSEESIIFGKNVTVGSGAAADFSRAATNNIVMEAVDILNWLVVYVERDAKAAKSFIDFMMKISGPMGISVSPPVTEVLKNDKTETYVQAIRNKLNDPKIQIVVIIFPTLRDDRYAAVKRVCCAEAPIPSQVINSRTLKNEAKNRSIVQKIALQMNCKLGGTLWAVKIPLRNTMICGIDTYHEIKGNSVSGFVASINSVFTRWYSKAVIQNKKEELVNAITSSLKLALTAYEQNNKQFPDRIIIFRDGVGDGQIRFVEDYEIPQLKTACNSISQDYNPQITYVIVQKRINAKLMKINRNELINPNAGLIVDHTITRKYMYDFFLVPQTVRQGTVTPSHFIVVQDACDFSPDILQRLAYKLCFLYYNWPGTIRVPACCQYAHKLAYLVGMAVKRPTAEKLADKLFYL